jgi:nitronate monooxygenase
MLPQEGEDMSSFTKEGSWKVNRITSKLKIEYPIIQGPLGGFSSQRLTASVSNFGGLGSFGAHGQTPEAITEVIAEIRSLTDKPFAMNLWASMEDAAAFTSDASDFQRSLAHIAPHLLSLGVEQPVFHQYKRVRFEDQARVLLDAKVPVFSFIYGIPPRELLDEFRRIGTVLIGTATTAEEARALEEAGVDLIVASGFEAGGHRGSFIRSSEASLTGTFALVPQVVDSVALPVVAAGGIADVRGIAAALALGAEGVQMGTAFLACEGSGASEIHRSMLLNKEAAVTGLTRGFTGRLARGIYNSMMESWNTFPQDILPYPLQRQMVRSLSIPAQAAGRKDLIPLWAGQSANLCTHSNVVELLRSLVTEMDQIGDSIHPWKRKRAIDDQA